MKASDWISVKDRLPNIIHGESDCKYSDEVLICLQENEMLMAVLVKRDNEISYWASTLGGYTYPVWLATYWQPIVLPKKKSYEDITFAT